MIREPIEKILDGDDALFDLHSIMGYMYMQGGLNDNHIDMVHIGEIAKAFMEKHFDFNRRAAKSLQSRN